MQKTVAEEQQTEQKRQIFAAAEFCQHRIHAHNVPWHRRLVNRRTVPRSGFQKRKDGWNTPTAVWFLPNSPDFAFAEKRFPKRISPKQNGDFVTRRRLMKKDGVLLFFMKTENQRGFCHVFTPCRQGAETVAFSQNALVQGALQTKESRLDVGSVSIGTGYVICT